jgi:RNA polymerase I-specific transcription initiation factor RRN6
MVENSLPDLKYGHVGPSAYDLSKKGWLFGRGLGRVQKIHQSGTFKQLLRGTRPSEAEESVRNEAEKLQQPFHRQLNSGISDLVRTHPEVAPSSALLSTLHRVSEAVSAAVAKYDPAKGCLITHGTILANDQKDRDVEIHVVAVPGGLNGEALRLVRLRTQPYGWPATTEHVSLPCPTDEVGWWVGKGAPIQQLCFAESLDKKDRTSLLAVRLPGCTVMFNPSYHSSAVPPAGFSVDCTYPPSRIGANIMFEITPTSSRTGVHADVTFNPWSHKQFAVIDIDGKWAIFQVEHLNDYGKIRVPKSVRTGHIKDQPSIGVRQESPNKDLYKEDGWARILWAGNTNSIIICTRLRISSFTLDSGAPSEIGHFTSSGACHLDLVRCPNNPQWVFLLTTEQVVWIQVSAKTDELADEDSHQTQVILCTRHFRNPSDITLTMRVVNDDKGTRMSSLNLKLCLQSIEILVTISSRYNEAVSTIYFAKPDELETFPTPASDPGQLVLPADMRPLILDSIVQRIKYDCGDGPWTLPRKCRFYSWQLLTRDLALRHVFLYATPNDGTSVPITELRRKWYDVRHARPIPRVAPRRDDFVLDDDLFPVKLKYKDLIGARRPSFKVTYNIRKEDPIEQHKRGATIDLTTVVEQVNGSLPIEDDTTTAEDILDVTSRLKDIILSGDRFIGNNEYLGEPPKTL